MFLDKTKFFIPIYTARTFGYAAMCGILGG